MNTIWIVLPILTVLMFDLGLTLKVKDFYMVLTRPKAFIVALTGQIILLPAIALGLGYLFGLQPIFFIGLMLIACSPGGSSSNIFSKLAGDDVALSVTLTALGSLITLVTLPLLMGWVTAATGAEVGIHLPVGNLLKQNLLLMLLVTIFFIQHYKTIFAHIGRIGLCVTALILLAAGCAALLSRFFRIDGKERRTVIIEVGMQNAAQAIALASSPFVFSNEEMAIPAILYSLMMNVVLLTYVAIIRRQKT